MTISKQLYNSSDYVAQAPRMEPDDLSKVIVSNALLFVSLALSIAISMVAMAAKLWLIRYISWVREPGSSHHRAMLRQSAYSGMNAWKLHRTMDSIPLLTLIPVFLFGIFIQ
jgi:hypothetical protein